MLILFLDESGSDNLQKIDPNYPILGIGGPIFREEQYYSTEDNRVKDLKRRVFGNDKIILRSSDITAKRGSFECLRDLGKEAEFIAEFSQLIQLLNFSFVSRMIDPIGHSRKYSTPYPSYELVLGLVLESFAQILYRRNETGRIYMERRGATPDRNVRSAYNAIKTNGTQYISAGQFQQRLPEDLHFYSKKENSSGLQIADMTIGPVTAAVLRGHFSRRDYLIVKSKFDRCHGLKKFPSPPHWTLH